VAHITLSRSLSSLDEMKYGAGLKLLLVLLHIDYAMQSHTNFEVFHFYSASLHDERRVEIRQIDISF
jgi:hypothetical protein